MLYVFLFSFVFLGGRLGTMKTFKDINYFQIDNPLIDL